MRFQDILFLQDFLQVFDFDEAVLAAFDLGVEGFLEEGGLAGDDVDEVVLSWVRGRVPRVFMISHALSRGRMNLK